jgi:hypothetical protein
MRHNFLNPTSIVIIGRPPISLAISTSFNLLDIFCYQYRTIPEDFIQVFSDAIVLTIDLPCQAIQEIHHLRKLQWQGTFVTLVSTPAEKEYLLNLSLFGEKDGRFAYGKIPGHKIAIIHSLIADILSFRKDFGLSSGAWRDYLVKSSIHTLIQQLQQTSINIQQVLATIHSINILWDTIISHEQARYIRELKQKYPLGTTPAASEIPQIITNLQTRLAHI